MGTIDERVAVIEVRMARLEATNELVLSELRKVSAQLTRYHGFAGGIAFVVSGMWIAWQMFGNWLRTKL
jgi:uncharacterized membrane protein